ncbi:MAG: hypothetical protein FWC20_08470 [Oscillospiraceae bacterium]|nr:hypothetical protein [Oscillospiraceae bacterium]MCL2279421.1 hypothetical protein [Oscillospiraceae bacterium]
MFYHASQTPGITVLKPRISNHGTALVYLSAKRQNVLVYLSNAVEKHCKQVGFKHSGSYRKWASYGFTKDGVLHLDEYYPNATIDTYKGESGYIYSAEVVENYREQSDIPDAIITESEVPVTACEYVPDAYEALLKAMENNEIVLRNYSDNSEAFQEWNIRTIKTEYQNASQEPEYREFLRAKFGLSDD